MVTSPFYFEASVILVVAIATFQKKNFLKEPFLFPGLDIYRSEICYFAVILITLSLL